MGAARKLKKTAKLRFERVLWNAGCTHVVGVDEAGRGAWAGPVYAGAVCLPHNSADLNTVLEGVRDSKQMTKLARSRAVEIIKQTAKAWGIGYATNQEIEHLGIVAATCLAMERALEICCAKFPNAKPDFLLLDSTRCDDLKLHYSPVRPIIRGDQKSLSIAAASVLAKFTRDEYMLSLDVDALYKRYEFGVHKGYGTAKHRVLLEQFGVSNLHRRNYKPIRSLLEGSEA